MIKISFYMNTKQAATLGKGGGGCCNSGTSELYFIFGHFGSKYTSAPALNDAFRLSLSSFPYRACHPSSLKSHSRTLTERK